MVRRRGERRLDTLLQQYTQAVVQRGENVDIPLNTVYGNVVTSEGETNAQEKRRKILMCVYI